ncbi:hamartin-like [Ruditapes philippinarum]|uniref:hamartin-like n=1 Tax=Ruditapes philippinarum TaxID=129788 RepID=UPI00295AB73E|nr:hamartin-like [Ruditapes philippinarum]
MTSNVTQIDVKTGVLSPDVFSLLESQEIQVCDGIKTLIQENLASTKEAWLVHSLVDYYYMTQSYSVVDILCGVQDPHDKNLLEKLHDGIKSQEHQLNALQLLLHIVCKQPLWINKIVKMSVLKVILKCLKTETSIPVLTTGVTIVTVLLPSIPTIVGPYLPDLFEIFNKLASFSVKRPPGNTPDIFYLHLQISVYALFHRLYGMFPYTFLAYLRQYYAKKENIPVFEEVIKSMLERVRLHPSLITGNREQETSTQRWRQMETSDVVVECNKMSLDPVEGTWEELQCPIIASRYLSDRPATNQERQGLILQPLKLPSVSMATTGQQDTNQAGQDTFWSPSEVIGLSTPPATPALSSLETSLGGTTTSHVSPAVILNAGTPMNTPRETPPISEEHDRHASRTSSRGAPHVKLVDPKRLSSEFPVNQSVPLLTPSSNMQSVPPSPLKAEFTNTPPLGVKTLPVMNAARELQFDHDQSDEKTMGHVTRLNPSHEFSKNVVKPEPFEIRPPRKISEGQMSASGQNTPRRSGSATMFEDSLRESSQDTGEVIEKVRTPSVSSVTKADRVSVDTISQVIEELESQPSHDEDSDDEVSELTSSSRSHGIGHSAMLTSESVKKFMKNVNRIRFNSLTATNSIEPEPVKGFSCKRSRSCPQFPKIETTMEEDEELISRSVSVTCQNTSHEEIEFKSNFEEIQSEAVKEPIPVAPVQPTDNICDISISSTGSMVTVNKKQEPVAVASVPSPAVIPVPKCPVYSGKSDDVETNRETDDLLRILKQILNMPSATTCAKCQGQMDGSQIGPSKPFFSTFSPPELLDRHISLGKDIHAKELSKLPIPSTQEVNWTHFGGTPPADEVSILRGQLMLLHNQLMYERHKRDQHAKRNRRLLRKIAHSKTLEEQNNSMSEQLKQNDVMIRDLQVSIKLLQEENHKLKKIKDDEEHTKLVQLRACLQENEDLNNAKKELNMLLVRQREEQDTLKKRIMATEAKLFNTEKELEKMRDVANHNTKLKEQVGCFYFCIHRKQLHQVCLLS